MTSPPPPAPQRRAPSDPDPQNPSERRLAARGQVRNRTRVLVLLAVVGLICSMFSTLPHGWIPLTVGAAALTAAAGVAISLYPPLVRAKATAFAHAMVTVVLGMTLLFALNLTVTAATWGLTAEYRECVQNSLTISSQASCQQILKDSLLQGIGVGG